MSQVEELFAKIQQEVGGNLLWHDLGPREQYQFVEAVKYILIVCQERK